MIGYSGSLRLLTSILPFMRIFSSIPEGLMVSGDALEEVQDRLPAIQWGACLHIDNTTMAFSALECGTLVVPLDHSAHLPLESYNDSNTVTLGMARLRAIESTTGSDHDLHRESLIINPGGPGGIASFSLLHQFELESLPSPGDRVPRGMVSHAIRQKYDLIGLDPRGVGLSQAIRCNETLREDRPDILVRTREDYEAVGVWNRQYAQSCLDMSGDLVRYVDSVSVARDFELVRQVSLAPLPIAEIERGGSSSSVESQCVLSQAL